MLVRTQRPGKPAGYFLFPDGFAKITGHSAAFKVADRHDKGPTLTGTLVGMTEGYGAAVVLPITTDDQLLSFGHHAAAIGGTIIASWMGEEFHRADLAWNNKK